MTDRRDLAVDIAPLPRRGAPALVFVLITFRIGAADSG